MRGLLQLTLDFFAAPDQRQAVPSVSPVAPDAVGLPAPSAALQLPDEFRHPRANRETRLGGAIVGYEFKRGKRRTIGFSVGPEGLVVSAPRWVTLAEVQSALNEKSRWIANKLIQTRERHDRILANRIEWKDGATVPFLGQSVVLQLDPRHAFDAAGAVLQQDAQTLTGEHRMSLRIGLTQQASAEQIRDAVQAWLMRQARRVFVERLDHFAPRLQVQWRKLSLSSAGTRWGSARSDGAIRLHWRLIHFQTRVIDYVVVHELSHLRVMNHSPQFWDTVRSVVPDYEQLRRQLKDEAITSWS